MNRSKLSINEQPNVKRSYAIELIKTGKLNGFAAFQNEKMIGFCNADAKENYYRLSRENYPNSWNGLENNDKVLSIVCFVIDVGMRGQGVATALLKEIMNYAVVHKFDYMEAYPSAGEFNTANCCGPVSMYEKQGFSIIHNNNSEVIVRKKVM